MGAHTKCRIGIGGRQRKEIYETRKSGSRERGPRDVMACFIFS